MAALTADRATPRRSMQEALYDTAPVAAGVEIFAGSIVEMNADGFMQPAGTAGDGTALWAAFATHYANNVGGGDGDADLKYEFRSSWLFQFADGDFARNEVGSVDLYVVDDQTVSREEGDLIAGRCTHWDSPERVWLELDGPLAYQSR